MASEAQPYPATSARSARPPLGGLLGFEDEGGCALADDQPGAPRSKGREARIRFGDSRQDPQPVPGREREEVEPAVAARGHGAVGQAEANPMKRLAIATDPVAQAALTAKLAPTSR